MVNTVTNLSTQYFLIESGTVLTFPTDRHRTYFAIQDRENSSVHIWIGPTDPPGDVDQWFSIGGTDAIDILHLERGVFGPVHITESAQGDGEITILSAVTEVPTITMRE